MIQFEKELEKFKPILDINRIEHEIKEDDIKDLSDLLKEVIDKVKE